MLPLPHRVIIGVDPTEDPLDLVDVSLIAVLRPYDMVLLVATDGVTDREVPPDWNNSIRSSGGYAIAAIVRVRVVGIRGVVLQVICLEILVTAH